MIVAIQITEFPSLRQVGGGAVEIFENNSILYVKVRALCYSFSSSKMFQRERVLISLLYYFIA